MIRVIVADDQTLIRQGISNLLSLSGKVSVIAEAENGKLAVTAINTHKPDVVLMDVRMPVMTGIEALKMLRDNGDQTPIILLTTFEDSDNLKLAMKYHANGYLLKDVSLDGLISSVELVLEGQSIFDSRLNKQHSQNLSGAASKVSLSNFASQYELTSREFTILKLLGEGASNKEIASSLHLKMGTVKNYVSSILLKLDVRDRTQAVIKIKEQCVME